MRRTALATRRGAPVNSTLDGTVAHVLPLAPSRAQRAHARQHSCVGSHARSLDPALDVRSSGTGSCGRSTAPAPSMRLSSLSAGAPYRASAQVRCLFVGGDVAFVGQHALSHAQHHGLPAVLQGRPPAGSFVGNQSEAPHAFGSIGCSRTAVPPNIPFNRTPHGVPARPRAAQLHVAPRGRPVPPRGAG